MTTEQSEDLLRPFVAQAKKDGDPYVVAIFSREEDRYCCGHDGLDQLDAMILIKGLVKHYKIDELLLLTALK